MNANSKLSLWEKNYRYVYLPPCKPLSRILVTARLFRNLDFHKTPLEKSYPKHVHSYEKRDIICAELFCIFVGVPSRICKSYMLFLKEEVISIEKTETAGM